MKVKPDFNYEQEVSQNGYKIVIGVDEVGRGAIAGPIVVGAVVIFNSQFPIFNDWLRLGIDDSKRLTAIKRERLDKLIRENCVCCAVAESSVYYINKYGIVKATERAIRSAIAELNKTNKANKTIKARFLLLDAFEVKNIRGIGLRNQKAIIKGDQKSLSIAAASIIAKVYRDALMVKLATKHKEYKWDINKGYGTSHHRKAIKNYGLTKHHRLKFVTRLR